MDQAGHRSNQVCRWGQGGQYYIASWRLLAAGLTWLLCPPMSAAGTWGVGVAVIRENHVWKRLGSELFRVVELRG